MNTACSKAISKIGGAITSRDGTVFQLPLFAYTRHHGVAAQPYLTSSRQSGFTLIELMIVISILALLMVIAIPTYSTFVVRTKVSECLSNAAPMKLAISETAMSIGNGNFPANAAAAGIDPATMATLDYCEASTYAASGVLTIAVDEAAAGATGVVEFLLVPAFVVDGHVTWDCQPGATTGEAMRYLPADCRM